MIRKLIVFSLFLLSLSFGLSFRSRTSAENSSPARKPAPNPNQWALLIGVGDYAGSTVDLKYPGADARSIKDLLVSSAGFPDDHVRLLTDDGVGEAKATKQNIFSAIDQYLAPRVQSGHEIIVFLAGHGIVDGVGTQARSYFLSVDTDIQSKETVARTAIDMEELTRKVSALKASQFTIFYDACREDPSPGRGFKGNPLTDVTARILTLGPTRAQQVRVETPPTSVVFYACQIGERAFESQQLQHGVFTYYILRGLRELADRPDGRVEAGRLAGYLSENVHKWSQEAKNPFGNVQTPTMVASEVRGPVTVARVLPFSANLPEAPAVSGIRLTTFPEGATISINGQQAGRGPIQKDLPPGQYTARAELPGFQPSEAKINVLPGYRQEVTINLQASMSAGGGNSNYEKGVQFEQQQLWPQAIASYQQALSEDPNSVAVYGSLAQAYVKNGRYSEAVNLLNVAAQKFPDNALILARRSRARSALKLGDGAVAASFGPQSSEAPVEGSGKKSKKSKSTRKSKKKDEEAVVEPATQSPAPQPEEESGKKTRKSKSSKKSKKKDEETAVPPSGSQSFAPQSNEGANQGSGEESGQKSEKKSKKSNGGKGGKKSKKESSEERQSDEIKSRSLADAFAPDPQGKNQGSSDAIRDAELAIQKDGNLAEAHLALGFALLADAQDYDRALASFVRASTITPEEAEAYYGVGYAYRLKQQCDQAVPQLKKAIELRPDYYEAQRELAYCYHATGATDLAIKQYVKAMSYRGQSDSSDYAANNLALAALYRKKGDEIGGLQGEEFRKTGKACEDDARKEEPDLKRAAKRLGSAGVLRFVQEKAPPEIRPILQGLNFLNGGGGSRINTKAPINVKVPIGKGKIGIGLPLPISIGSKEPKVSKPKSPKGGKGTKIIRPPINIGPIRPKRSEEPKGDKGSSSGSGGRPYNPKGDKSSKPITRRPTLKAEPKPTPKPSIIR
ncbi:MAG TPA: caspase family protein [Blastocatellia bacterium]|nr:caspase family protein [Blastocatellia bacterium]